ncbi:MAG: hypothetical protein NTW19_08720 [Planctomycetota bacterium]|nr:hypothetical protein [Planctomycetota bacterium]
MALRRRNALPPYEVMGQASSRSPAGRPGPTPEPSVISRAPSDRPVDGPGPLGGTWLDRAQQPMRVPQIMFLWLLLFFVAGVSVAFWAGKVHGYTQHLNETRATRAAEEAVFRNGGRIAAPTSDGLMSGNSNPPIGPAPGKPTRPTTSGSSGTSTGHTGTPTGQPPTALQPPAAAPGVKPPAAVPPSGTAARQSGLNYMVLATLPEDEAGHLAQFLREHGVDAGAFARHNSRSFQVVALRGFTREQLASPVKQEFEKELRRLGRVWKDQKNGATNLADMYMDLYKEDPAAATPPTNRKPPR